ncbi:MAG: N-acetylneuraminate synthase family protein [bacterium]
MRPYIIAEIGCNHKGDLEIAKEMIRMVAEFCKVPCAKFQKRNPKEILSPQEFSQPHPTPWHSYGDSYGAHREFLEFSVEQHRVLKDYCHQWNIEYTCSVWDMTSARDIVGLEPRRIKIPSACNTNLEIVGYLCDKFPGEIHVSLGMTTKKEIEDIVTFFKSRGRAQDVVLYHCTSAYPVPFADTHLMEIKRLGEAYGGDVKGIGYSGHHRGIAIDLAAYVLGATFFERHFTLDRTWKGTDHAASLESDGLRRLARDLGACADAMTLKPKDILDIEEDARRKLKWDRNL